MPFRRVKNHAHQALGQAQMTMSDMSRLAESLAEDVRELLGEVADGITIELELEEGTPLRDLLSGKTRKLPISLKITIEEKEET